MQFDQIRLKKPTIKIALQSKTESDVRNRAAEAECQWIAKRKQPSKPPERYLRPPSVGSRSRSSSRSRSPFSPRRDRDRGRSEFSRSERDWMKSRSLSRNTDDKSGASSSSQGTSSLSPASRRRREYDRQHMERGRRSRSRSGSGSMSRKWKRRLEDSDGRRSSSRELRKERPKYKHRDGSKKKKRKRSRYSSSSSSSSSASDTKPKKNRETVTTNDFRCPFCHMDMQFKERLEIHKLWKHVEESYQELELNTKFGEKGAKPDQLALLGQILSTMGNNVPQLASHINSCDDIRERDPIAEASVYLLGGHSSSGDVAETEAPSSAYEAQVHSDNSQLQKEAIAMGEKTKSARVFQLPEEVVETSKDVGHRLRPVDGGISMPLTGNPTSLFAGFTFYIRNMSNLPNGISADQVIALIDMYSGQTVRGPWNLTPNDDKNIVLISTGDVVPSTEVLLAAQHMHSIYKVDVLHATWVLNCVAQRTLLERSDYRIC